jgi:ABC-type amino acid transport substrate-binding protein
MSSLEAIWEWAGVDADLFNRLSISMGGTPTHPRKIALIPHHAWDQALLGLPNVASA